MAIDNIYLNDASVRPTC